ncbi:RNA polymerase sigma factor [Clostridium sp. TW13]|uniref:RNA polymerase sigma factor n=1 Tax=Inconstantimicrobium mannanitabidum TaxID=1604901 RepID=A0ACB5RIF8_9CLOT|nr:RNA polymerase sigma factor [Clostridium sp. TW13]
MKLDDDKELVRQVLNGNTDSFNIIVNKYEITILKIVYNMIRNKEAAEDITQEVFITAYNKLYMYIDKYKLSNWLIQIAKNKTIDYIRKYKKVYEANIDDFYDMASKEEGPDSIAEFNETRTVIGNFINTLDETEKDILILRYSGERSFGDISQILNLNESMVKRKYYNLRERFMSYRKSSRVKEG